MPETELDKDLELDLEPENVDEDIAADAPDHGRAEEDAEEELVFESDSPSGRATDEPREEQLERPGVATLPKRLRNEITARNKELAKARQEIAELKAKAFPQQEVNFGPEPTMSDPDIAYDETKLKAKYNAWRTGKDEAQRRVDAEKKSQADRQAELDKQWAAKQAAYIEQRTKVSAKVTDFAEAEDEVVLSLSLVQMSLVQAYADRPAAVVYTLGKNSKELKRLAEIQDPARFIVELVRLEERKRSMGTKPETRLTPERTVRSDSAGTRGFDATLEKMEKDWEKSGGGSRQHIIEYKRKLKEKAATRR